MMTEGAGKADMTGAVMSCTWIVCEAVELLPQPSVAVHILVTVYEPAHELGDVWSACVNTILLPHPSVADAVANTGVAGQNIVEGAGSEPMTGADTSCTTIVCAAVELLPQSSTAVQVLVTVYAPAHAP